MARIQQAETRYGFLDSIRGVAACLVMLQHSLYSSGVLGGPASAHLTGFIPTRLELGETGVVAFFIVSGFVIPFSLEKTNSFKLFWIHRALRIYPLYVAAYLVTIILQHASGIVSAADGVKNIIAHALFIQEYLNVPRFVAGAWTLSLEAAWYAIISLLFLMGLNRKINVFTIATIIVSIAAQAACAMGFHLPMGRISMFICFVVGLLFYRRINGEVEDKTFVATLSVLLTCIGLNLLVGLKIFLPKHPTTSFELASNSWLLAGGLFLVPYFLRKSAVWEHGVFVFLGRTSYSVYLMHPIVIYLLLLLNVHGVIILPLTFAATTLLSFASYRWIETPPIRFGHRFKSPPPAASAITSLRDRTR